MTTHELNVVRKMEQYGGSFVKALAECFYRADQINFSKLRECFDEYWKRYEAMISDEEEVRREK